MHWDSLGSSKNCLGIRNGQIISDNFLVKKDLIFSDRWSMILYHGYSYAATVAAIFMGNTLLLHFEEK